MPQQIIQQFSLSGDLDLFPRSAPSFQALMWADWRVNIPERLQSAEPYIQVESPTGKLFADCHMDDNKLRLIAFDVDGDFKQAFPVSLDLTLGDFGRGNMAKYLTTRVSNNGFTSQDIIRREMHDKMVDVMLEKVKKAGLAFTFDHRAKTAFRDLTAYWFSLLEANEKLVLPSLLVAPRNDQATKAAPVID